MVTMIATMMYIWYIIAWPFKTNCSGQPRPGESVPSANWTEVHQAAGNSRSCFLEKIPRNKSQVIWPFLHTFIVIYYFIDWRCFYLTQAAKWPVQATGRANLRLPPASCKVVMMISTMVMVMSVPCKKVIMMISTMVMMLTISTRMMVMTMSMIWMTADGHHNMHVLQLVTEKAISWSK